MVAMVDYEFDNVDDYKLASCEVAAEVEGEVKSMSGKDEYFYVNGQKYYASSMHAGKVAKGDKGTFYLDPNGFVVGFEETEEEAVKIDDVIYTIATYTKTEKDEYETATVTTYLQYMNLAGEVDTMVIAIDGEDDYGTDKYAMGALYTYTTYSAKKVIDGVNYKGCAKLTSWTGDDDYTVGTIAVDTELESGDKKVEAVIGGKDQVRLNNKTTYIMVDGKKADVEVKVATGGVNTTVVKTATVIATEVSKNYVASIVLLPGSEIDTTVSYEDVIYVDSSADFDFDTIEDTDVVTYAVYTEDGKNELTISVADDAVAASGFYTYSIDEDGIYELEPVEAVVLTENYEDEAGVVAGAFKGIFEGLVTLDTKFVVDVDANDAVIINLTDADVDTLKEIEDFEGTVAMTMYVNEGAKVIVITEAVEA